ncbi:ABC transporter ATP-binding protein [Methanosphaerula palustris]|uniref:ABC transporter related n=1 Tax=Methanosphaerula palustris (strain ATCC BAA-1556 / DSM 19958 / E1-9c) TaxID=521011 RepID=B8GHI2_METPE|nr:ABC transporter ATP-binding protein [Methanosphaerula palustris]ACL16587.1 ABC transporter related [Methanosphaerula palustris E1-9c]
MNALQPSDERSDQPVLLFDQVTKIYPLPAGDVVALDHVSLKVYPGEFIAIMGPSGSGKTTLLNMMGCLDIPTSGDLIINGSNVKDLSDDELTWLRRDTIGFIFQHFNLIPLLSVLENVEFPLILKCQNDECGLKPLEVLKAAGLDDVQLYTHKPSELSGGQQQRVAIARALVNDPDILLCDEPTGNLDSKTGKGIMDLLTTMNQDGKTIIMVTHDASVADYASRMIRIVDGRIA